ncbi:MAG: hypothetical protein ACTII7_08815 [Galactobacter sp.]
MTLTRRIHPEAAAELSESAAWYETERVAFDSDFLAEVIEV